MNPLGVLAISCFHFASPASSVLSTQQRRKSSPPSLCLPVRHSPFRVKAAAVPGSILLGLQQVEKNCYRGGKAHGQHPREVAGKRGADLSACPPGTCRLFPCLAVTPHQERLCGSPATPKAKPLARGRQAVSVSQSWFCFLFPSACLLNHDLRDIAPCSSIVSLLAAGRFRGKLVRS